jgi:sialate O-acetylesterase
MKKLILAAVIAVACSGARGEVEMDPIFASGMVLQRQLPVPVWGSASAGEKITVSFAGQSRAATADAKGAWMVTLTPLKASAKNRTMIVKGANAITFTNVLVGEVWLCSGQSNMAGKFVKSKGRAIAPKVFKQDLSKFRFTTRFGWSELTTKSQQQLSCVAFYFGIELYRKLEIPIGLVQKYNSGTPIQAWMPKAAAEVIRKKLGIPVGWGDEAKNRNPGVQFDDKIASIVPLAFRGAIWYQGERNAKAQTGWEYDALLAFHIKTWRELWAKRAGQKLRKFPFYYVQVPTQEGPPEAEWPWLRDRMRRALAITENTGMAVFYDYGPSLHPPNKQPAGKRLSLWALAKDYGRYDLVHSGPLLDKVRIDGARAILTFKHVGGGLESSCGGKDLKFFEIAGKDAKYLPAAARIEGGAVVVQNEKITKPIYVRYLFRKPKPDPQVSLINAEGLPASSFITDDLKPKRLERLEGNMERTK